MFTTLWGIPRRCVIRRALFIVGFVVVLLSLPVAAQDKVEYPVNMELSTLFGYRTNMTFRTEPDAEGVSPRVSLNSSSAPALSFGVRYHDEDVVEFRWIRQDTRLRVSAPSIGLSIQNVTLDQFHLDCAHEYVLEEWPAWARPYIMGSIGATRISTGDDFGGFTRFSLGLGTGIKIFPFQKIGFKVQAQWLALWVNGESKAFCNGGCLIRFSGKLVSQGEVTAGPVFRF